MEPVCVTPITPAANDFALMHAIKITLPRGHLSPYSSASIQFVDHILCVLLFRLEIHAAACFFYVTPSTRRFIRGTSSSTFPEFKLFFIKLRLSQSFYITTRVQRSSHSPNKVEIHLKLGRTPHRNESSPARIRPQHTHLQAPNVSH